MENRFKDKKRKQTIKKSIASGLILVALVGGVSMSAVFYPARANAAGIPTIDIANIGQWLLQLGRDVAERAQDIAWRIEDHGAAIAFKSSLHLLLNNFAYDTATWLAAGGNGQTPYFNTDNWGDYLTKAVDGAAGNFISILGKDWLGFNVCKPDLPFRINLVQGFQSNFRRSRPDCSASQLAKNWDNFVQNPDFLSHFVKRFNSDQNEILMGIKLYDQYYQVASFEALTKEQDRKEGGGFLPVTSAISGKILTPSGLTKAQAQALVDHSLDAEKISTGDIIADAMGTFVKTLAGKLFDNLFKKGLASLRGSSGSNSFSRDLFSNNDLYTGQSGTDIYKNQQATAARYVTLVDAGIITGGPYEVLQKLSSCPNQDNPGPEDCVIGQDFRLAIEKQMTVREAIAAGRIDGNAPFGFNPQGFEPPYNEGYPYRSLLILRTHRIIPVTWELAAKIVNLGLADRARTTTLNALIADYNNNASPFYHLIDENWVLKAPEEFCKAEGYGSVVLSDRISSDGKRVVTRDTYCADYQSCIEKDSKGNCIYGYCTQEQGAWNLQADSCIAAYSTCQTFVNPAGQSVSYLQNTLNYNSCSADNVGCQWYCKSYNVVNGVWTCVNDAEQVLKPCANPGGCPLTAGCNLTEGGNFCADAGTGASLTISSACGPNTQWWQADLFGPGVGGCRVNASCNVAYQGVQCTQTGCENRTNQLTNSGFETAAPAGQLAAGWGDSNSLTYFNRVSGGLERIHSGRNSIRFYNVGGVAGTAAGVTFQSNPQKLPQAGSYTFSGYVFDRLNVGNITFEVHSVQGNSMPAPLVVTQDAKNRWRQVSFDFNYVANDDVQIIVTVKGEQVSGTAWFDDFQISTSCLVNPVTLTLAGTVAQDQSKIDFDRDAGQCGAQGDGCSQFYTSPTKQISNLLFSATDPSFEIYQDSLSQAGDQEFKNWNAVNNQATSLRTIVKASTDAHSGATAMQLQDDGGKESYTSLVFTASQPLNSRQFMVSYYAKLSSGSNFQCLSEGDFVLGNVPTGCHTGGVGQANFVRVYDGTPGLYPLNGISSKGLDQTWKRFSAIIAVPGNLVISGNPRQLEIILRTIPAANGYILYDDIQLEEITNTTVTDPSPFQGYTTLQQTHLRKAPDYLGCQGFTLERPSDYVLNGVTQASCIGDTLVWLPESCAAAGPQYCCHQIDPPECFGYAPYCQADEIGCQSFKPVRGGATVPAVAAADDYCPLECVGYAAFKQAPTYFESTQSIEFFIPSTAKQCSVSSAGCDEFTNLDKIAAGGEGKEYYLYLRQCAKPDAAGVTCGNYYGWQGADDTGYQLTTYSLKNNGAGPDEVIDYNLANLDLVAYPDAWCNNKADGDGNGRPDCCDAADDLATNPFCRELFDSGGIARYLIYDNTVSCSQDCHPYRKTRLGESDSDAEANCDQSNGDWNDTSKECTYQAIPDQGSVCSAAAAGCREYHGNAGGNVFTAFSDNFEDGDTAGWLVGQMSSVALSVGGHSIKSQTGALETLYAGVGIDQNGNGTSFTACDSDLPACNGTDYPCYQAVTNTCLAINSSQTCEVLRGEASCGVFDPTFVRDRDYLFTFWARSESGNNQVTIQFNDGSASLPTIAQVALTPTWQYYSFGPIHYAQQYGNFLVAQGTSDFFLDNITFKEITGYNYVIKNSWQTPTSCDTNPFVNPPVSAPQFMLGCQQYRDLNNQVNNLKSFTNLCREDAVGCEAMIDTFNSNDQFSQEFNTADPVGQVTVPADRVVTMVNRAEFRCDANQEGCQLLGKPNLDQSGAVSSYNDAYLINDPDQYETTLCGSGEVGCQEFQTDRGSFYFKEPGLQTCQYKQIPNQPSFGWFKFGSAAATPDCPIKSSQLGLLHPANGWVGECPAEANGCTEFVDPVSTISKNILFNPTFEQNVDGPPLGSDAIPDGWNLNNNNPAQKYLKQAVLLDRNTLYTLALTVNGVSQLANFRVSIADCPNLASFDNSLASVDSFCVGDSSQCTTDADCNTFDEGYDCATNVWQLPATSYSSDTRAGLSDIRSYSGRLFVATADPTARCTVVLTDTNAAIANKDTIKGNLKIQEVALRETGVYHVLAQDVDRLSCNGIVDSVNGCVLFNDRNEVNFSINENDSSYLRFDADVSGLGINGGVPVAECAGSCDSSVILKVRPDRTCGQWLDCKTKIKAVNPNGETKDYCLAIDACSRLDESGTCTRFVPTQLQTLESDTRNLTLTNRDRLANLSGYITAGIKGFNPGIEGYYPYGLMQQRGEVAVLRNGDFEELEETSYPLGWLMNDEFGTVAEADWNRSMGGIWRFSELQELEGGSVSHGDKVFRLGSLYRAVSEPLDVFNDAQYAVSLDANTVNLRPQGAKFIAVVGLYNSRGELLPISDAPADAARLGIDASQIVQVKYPQANASERYILVGTLEAGRTWQSLSSPLFNTSVAGHTVSSLRIMLLNLVDTDPGNIYECDPAAIGPTQGCLVEGATYIDAINVLPLLEYRVKDSTVDADVQKPEYVSRDCRIYPDAGSLSCTYTDDTGKTFRGWSGFCLLPDPRDSNICLQWWPVGLIKGDFFEQLNGYHDRAPIYYCYEGTLLESRSVMGYKKNTWEYGCKQEDIQTIYYHRDPITGQIDEGPDGSRQEYTVTGCPSGYTASAPAWQRKKKLFGLIKQSKCFYLCTPNGDYELTDPGDKRQYYPYDGGLFTAETDEPPGRLSPADADKILDAHPSWEAKDVVYAGVHFQGDGIFSIGDAETVANTRGDIKPGQLVGATEKFAPACYGLVQTVTPAGNNKAWVARVEPGSGYRVPTFNFRYETDYQPFGAVVAPDPVGDPTIWGKVLNSSWYFPLTMQVPDTSLQVPYQPRAGAFYACWNRRNDKACGIGVGPEDSDIPLIYFCKGRDYMCIRGISDPESYDVNNPVPLPKTIADAEREATERIKRLFAKSYGFWRWNSAQIGYKPFDSTAPIGGVAGQCGGTWHVDDGREIGLIQEGSGLLGTCVDNVCTLDHNVWCADNGDCDDREISQCGPHVTGSVAAVGASISLTCGSGEDAPDTASVGYCTLYDDISRKLPCDSSVADDCPAAGRCYLNPDTKTGGSEKVCYTDDPVCPSGETCVSLDNTCDGPYTAYQTFKCTGKEDGTSGGTTVTLEFNCPDGDTACRDSYGCINDAPPIAVPPTPNNNPCNRLPVTCGDPTNSNKGECTAGHVNAVCSDDATCTIAQYTPNTYNWDPPSYRCEGTTTACVGPGDTACNCVPARCDNNVRPISSYECSGTTDGCTGLSDITSCEPGVNCVPALPNDYCAIAPLVKNIDLNGHTTDDVAIINHLGYGLITMRFNALVDANQIPLTSYRVDWGDEGTSITGTSLRDRLSENEPYILYHAFDYFQMLEKNGDPAFGERIYCSGETTKPSWWGSGNLPANSCAVRPRIQIFDNWRWCNAATYCNDGSAVPDNYCTADSQCGTGNQCEPVSGVWGYNGAECASLGAGANPFAWTYSPVRVIITLTE